MLHAAKKLSSYRNVAVDTASPGKLILMLFDGAIRFLRSAEDGFRIEGIRERQEAIHNNIMRAHAIVTELQRCLNLRDGGDFAINMFRLYDFMGAKLLEANTKKEAEGVRVVIQLLGEVRDAWDQMLNEQAGISAPAASLSMSA